MEELSPIFVAGHLGMVGSAVVRRLEKCGVGGVLTASKSELDLRDQRSVRAFFAAKKPKAVVMAAAKVGGILANSRQQAEFLLENMQIEANVIEAAAQNGTERLLFLGSSCIYPKHAPQPIPESALLTGPLEPTNEGYALAKIAGLKLCEFYNRQHGKRFISAMPTNLYGPGDNYHPEHSHVIAGLVRRFHEAKMKNLHSVKVWGTGNPKREFLHVDDLAEALVLLLERYGQPEPINVGMGAEVTIRELAEMIRETTEFQGKIEWDSSLPDGVPRKLLDSSRMSQLGWAPKIPFKDGLKQSYEWAVKNGRI